MAGRNEKHTVDYFPFYCKDGRTLFILESKYGCKGTGFFTNVMRFLCLTPDHHYCISNAKNGNSSAINTDRLYFFSRLHCDEESGMDMLNIMADSGKINKNLWLNHKIIFSEDLINSLSEAYRSRKNKPLTIELITSLYQLPTQEIELPTQEMRGNGINDAENTQRKEKKRKENIILGVYSNAFQAFWSEYPKSIKKKAAFKEWEKCPNKPSIEEILVALRAQKRNKAELSSKGLFCPEWPDPERWIKNERWNDELIPVPKNGNGIGDKQQESAYELCPSCGAELRKGYEYVIIGGKQCCEKCPQAKEKAKEDFKKLSGFMGGIKSMPATAT